MSIPGVVPGWALALYINSTVYTATVGVSTQS